MIIRHLFSALLLVSISVWAQSGGLGSMRDPRSVDQPSSLSGSIQPWLAINGNYDTALGQTDSSAGSIRRSLSVSGGLSATKSFQRTEFVLGYAGSGNDYLGQSAGSRVGWMSSNVLRLGVSSQVARHITLDFSEAGGAANGGFGAASAGMLSGGLGVLGSLDVSGGYLSGGSGLGSTSSGLDNLSNGLVDSDYYDQMTYFSTTGANAGFLLTNRTMLNVGGSGSIIRRSGRSFSDANMVGANAMISTQFSRRFSTFFGYSFTRVDFVKSIRDIYIQGGFAGVEFVLSPHDHLSLSVSESYLNSQFVTVVALPADVAALLGVSTTSVAVNNNRSVVGGRLSYNHSFQRGGFSLTCNSTVVPGNDLILMARAEGCTVSLSRVLTQRFSVNGVGGMRRLTGISQSGSRYDVFDGGVVFAYRMFRSVSLTAGADYRATEFHPSGSSRDDVAANAGLRWSPRDEINIF